VFMEHERAIPAVVEQLKRRIQTATIPSALPSERDWSRLRDLCLRKYR
jgi:hypothetical protein